MANGFANRFLVMMVKRSKMLPFGGRLDGSTLRQLGGRLRAAIETTSGGILTYRKHHKPALGAPWAFRSMFSANRCDDRGQSQSHPPGNAEAAR